VKLRATRYDDNGHGTHVTGTAVGHAGVNPNVIGVAPGATYIACKAFAADGFGDIRSILGCLQFMADPDANPLTDDLPDVVNGSWGGDVDCDPTFVQAVQALRVLDVVTVFAAGNKGVPAVPAAYPGAIAVGAVDRSNVVTPYSGRGPTSCRAPGAIYPDVVAPGTKVRSAWPGGTRKTLQGTSMAAPHVSGVVALIRSWNPTLSAAAVVNVVRAAAADLGPAGPDAAYGYGLVDAFRAVNCVRYGTASGCGAQCP
jgi:bacillopeptidase F